MHSVVLEPERPITTVAADLYLLLALPTAVGGWVRAAESDFEKHLQGARAANDETNRLRSQFWQAMKSHLDARGPAIGELIRLFQASARENAEKTEPFIRSFSSADAYGPSTDERQPLERWQSIVRAVDLVHQTLLQAIDSGKRTVPHRAGWRTGALGRLLLGPGTASPPRLLSQLESDLARLTPLRAQLHGLIDAAKDARIGP